jgi:hypothetical protein
MLSQGVPGRLVGALFVDRRSLVVRLPSDASSRRASWLSRVRRGVRLGRFSLDQALALGADPSTSRRLSRRALKLCHSVTRRKIAADLERVVEAADEPPRPLTAAVPLNRVAIRELRALLLTLAEDLRGAEPMNARGVALARLLLMDGYSPLYGLRPARELEEELRRTRAALLLD